jgi:tRNA A-37 threonylcarbamoyl transferase component Bud32
MSRRASSPLLHRDAIAAADFAARVARLGTRRLNRKPRGSEEFADPMRISTPANVAAILVAAALFGAAPAAWSGSFEVQPTFGSSAESDSSEQAQPQEEPAHNWNALGEEESEPRLTREERIRMRMRRRLAREAARESAAEQQQAEAAAPQEPPSFGDLDAVIPANARVEIAASYDRWAPRIQYTLDELYDSLGPDWQKRASAFRAFAIKPAGGRWLTAGLCALFLLLIAARSARGHGDLVVVITYPDDLRGSFSVSLSRRRPKRKRLTQAEREARAKTSSRMEHHLVSRETQFRGIAPGRYWVVVEGELYGSSGDAALEECFEIEAVSVGSRDTGRVEFDLKPRHCPVEVRVTWDGQPVRECAVSVVGRPDTFRILRGQSARMGLPLGRHLIALGSGDRVAEREVAIDGYANVTIDVDLGRAEGVLFKGCPPAVTPYLQGDVAAAARALAREGQDKLSNYLLARMHEAQGAKARAAEHYEYAEYFAEAAKLREAVSEWARAAALYQKAGQPLQAAEMFRRSGDPIRAGKAYEAAADYERALACYREAGETDRVIGVLERSGDSFQAAMIARQNDDRARAIKLLQQVLPGDPNYAEACLLLADALETEGHTDLAARKLEERIERDTSDGVDPALRSRLAELLERSGDSGRALDVLEKLREDEPTYPEIGTRIEALRRRLSSAREAGNRVTAATVPVVAESRYEIIEQIGRGGMGVVFRARDKRLGRELALKRLPENLRDNPAAVQLFLREARAAAALNHPNIVTIFDADQEDQQFFITMELLEGDPLHVILKRAGRLSARDTSRLGVQICTGLEYAHERRIVHRDIKTANLFFTRGKVVKIMDFGLAKMIEEVRRSATVIGGTPYYMAPEQAAGENVDGRADIYALGVTLFELVTGSVPFREGDVTYHHRHTPPPDPRTRAEGIPDGFAELILELMAKDPARRIQTAAAVAARLAPFTA